MIVISPFRSKKSKKYNKIDNKNNNNNNNGNNNNNNNNNNSGIDMGINEWINFSLVSFSWYRKLLKWLWKKFSWSITKFFVYKNKLHSHLWIMYPRFFFYKKNFYKKMSLKNPNTLRKCWENLQPQMLQL